MKIVFLFWRCYLYLSNCPNTPFQVPNFSLSSKFQTVTNGKTFSPLWILGKMNKVIKGGNMKLLSKWTALWLIACLLSCGAQSPKFTRIQTWALLKLCSNFATQMFTEYTLAQGKTSSLVVVSFLTTCCLWTFVCLEPNKGAFEISMNLYYKMNKKNGACFRVLADI